MSVPLQFLTQVGIRQRYSVLQVKSVKQDGSKTMKKPLRNLLVSSVLSALVATIGGLVYAA